MKTINRIKKANWISTETHGHLGHLANRCCISMVDSFLRRHDAMKDCRQEIKITASGEDKKNSHYNEESYLFFSSSSNKQKKSWTGCHLGTYMCNILIAARDLI